MCMHSMDWRSRESLRRDRPVGLTLPLRACCCQAFETSFLPPMPYVCSIRSRAYACAERPVNSLACCASPFCARCCHSNQNKWLQDPLVQVNHYHRIFKFSLYGSVCYACLACRACVTPASSPASHCLQRSRRLRSTRAAVPGLLAHAEVTENIIF
jgi:hypothetical protein